MKSFFRLLLLALVLLVVALVSALTAMRLAIHGRQVAVPELVGKAPAEARFIVEQIGLELQVERQYYSPTVPEGRILSQLPPAGSQVRRGFQVRVAESLGPQRVGIPNVLGQSQHAANINIRRHGLDVGAIAQMQLPDAVPDRVLSQDPPPNASGISAPKISLLVAVPSQPQAFVMASFVGQPLGSVILALQDAGLRVGTVTQASDGSSPGTPVSTPSPASIVASQNPAFGEKVLAGTVVNFEVR
ncbi:MAG TPA: PASTA domain-containing protein [Terriglobales bacterium]|jgi:beta-lactam-binding protein with PASTA domain|nr:PASTA domain-containing protein [Terriglobales bacterium]